MKKFTGKPIIKEGRLALKEINPLEVEPPDVFSFNRTDKECEVLKIEWLAAESALRTLFVKDGEKLSCILESEWTITADIDSNNELINLEIV